MRTLAKWWHRAVDAFAVWMASFGGTATFVFITVAFPVVWIIVGVVTGTLQSPAYNFVVNTPESVLALTLTAATLYVANKIARVQREEQEARDQMLQNMVVLMRAIKALAERIDARVEGIEWLSESESKNDLRQEH